MLDQERGVVVVTGASRGIGASISLALARDGFQVACLSRSGEIPSTLNEGDEFRDRLTAFRCDITNEASVTEAFSEVSRWRTQRIVGLVNNAGLHLQGPSAAFPTCDFDRVMKTNATSVLLVSQAAYPHLRGSEKTLIVNIGSFFDKLGVKGNAAYCASKAAVGAITRCLAVEWARDGIRVMNVAPGYIETDLNRDELNDSPLGAYLRKRIPTGGPGEVDDISELVSMLFRSPQPYLTGETLYIDGGQGIAL
jgi:NAD(P)-dependent dehydrogenase (short-subunit alcohol dehydrogenase family)